MLYSQSGCRPVPVYTAGYDDDEENEKYQNNRWNDNLKIFNFIDIYIYNYNNIDESVLAEILTHELTRACDDWILRKNGYSLRDKTLLKNKSNEEILNTVSDTIKLLGIRPVLDDDHEELKNIHFFLVSNRPMHALIHVSIFPLMLIHQYCHNYKCIYQ